MKKAFIVLVATSLLVTAEAKAQTYIEEVKALGYIAGQGLACASSKLDTFEMLARAIIITKATSNKNQADGMYTYNGAKADAYFSKQMDGFYGCKDIVRRFDRQEIFKSTLYEDGSIQMPDGQILTPRQPYDATILSVKDDKARDRAQKVYDKGSSVKVGEITINTEGSPNPIKVNVPNTSKASQTSSAPTQTRSTAATTRSSKVTDTSGIKHIKK